MRVLEIITIAFSLGLALSILWHLSNIWRYGSHYIQEPNEIVLLLEIIGIFILIIITVTVIVAKYIRAYKERNV